MSSRNVLSFLRAYLPQSDDFRAMKRAPGRDLVAGATVAIVALPLALAFGVASGLGAQAGIVTAVIAGIIAAVFGGSNLQVSGPTGAMTVVLVPIVAQHGPSGVLQVGLMAGLLVLVLAFSGVGRYVRMLPTSLIEGFTAGIAVVISLQQVPNMLGVPAGDQQAVWAQAADAVVRWAQRPDWAPLIITLVVTAGILFGARLKPGLPSSLIVIVAVTLVAQGLGLGVDMIGALPAGLPAPSLGFINWEATAELFPAALAVAALAALESLLGATVADGMSVGEEHNPDRELFGQGLANLVVPFFGGVPATAAIARTAVNVRAGARSRTAAISHSLILLAIIMLVGPAVGLIPLAALAGVLLATTVQMIEIGSIRTLVRATRSDAIILVTTFVITVAVDLITAVVVGLAVAALLALRSVAKTAGVERMPLRLDSDEESEAEQRLLREHIVPYRLEGPLFFGVAQRFLLELTEVGALRVIILRMGRVSSIDATGAFVLSDAVERLQGRGVVVLLSGIRPEHTQMLQRMESMQRLWDDGLVFAETPDAIAWASAYVRAN